MKWFIKTLAGILVLAMLLGFTALAGQTETVKEYAITNPYADVDWDGDSWKAYKTQLHCHTLASDGDVQLNDVVEEHYKLDYDILAITDHATVSKGWNAAPQTVPLFRLVKYERTGMKPIIPLTNERYQEILTGVGRDGRGMLDVEKGIELNGAVPSNSHLNGYFADYGQGLMGVDGDYETPARENGKLGGITLLDHLGTYTNAEKDPSQSDNPKHINKFANIFLNTPSCVGMDVNSGTNSDTRNDRVLYDNILQKTIPYGVVPWAFTFSDAHQMGQWDRAFTLHMMTELTNADLRRSMEQGTFFGIARYAKPELGETFVGEGPVPMVTKIEVDHEENTITITGENYDNIVWVANGVEIAEGVTIDINDYQDEITCYVRAYLTGGGGICYVQPFTVIEKGTELKKEDIPKTYDLSTFLRQLVTVVDFIFFKYNPLIWLFKTVALGLR
ncbi:MAG: hypothetical protein FWF05_03080 [Oscillospiraceae bacterium]|nr:hypothetical protein [Oscillospiraceae bacterium]